MRRKENYKKILLVRTDRLGDVVLSTPVAQSLKQYYPQAHIAMMVSPGSKEVAEASPYIDEVIVYDKDLRHKSWFSSLKFTLWLKRKKFDLALILHPTNRVHIVTFFSGIPRRIGYDRKLDILLTDRLKHTKQLGEKHESEYALDFIRYLGFEPGIIKPHILVKPETEKWVQELLFKEGILAKDKVLGIHPAASCPSKMWPVERFAELADLLADRYEFKVLVFSGTKDIDPASKVVSRMKNKAFNLAGKTTISQLSSLIKRCSLFISNDSGPVHLAASLGVPVISIFGRKQAGLSPLRWGPLGSKSKVLHKDAGCVGCLAHNCIRSFACLDRITVEEVFLAAQELLRNE